jgi:hypothetical protein
MDKEKVRTHWSRVFFTVCLSFIFGGMSPSRCCSPPSVYRCKRTCTEK